MLLTTQLINLKKKFARTSIRILNLIVSDWRAFAKGRNVYAKLCLEKS